MNADKLPMTPERAVRAVALVLAYNSDPAQIEQALNEGAARGVDPADLAELRAEWDARQAKTVVQLPRSAASIPAHLCTDTLPDYLRQKGEL